MNNYGRKCLIPVSAVLAAAAMLALSCKPAGPPDWDAFEEKTIEKNLASLESAADIYAAKLAAGDIDAAAREAQAALMASPGVDTAGIAPDSSVWALFSNGLLAGTGTIPDSGLGAPSGFRPAGTEAASSGDWEVMPRLTVVTPSATEMPISAAMGLMADAYLHDIMCWPAARVYADTQASRDAARDLLASGPGVFYWAGHGIPVWVPGVDWVCGLMLGTTYQTRAMAQAAAGDLLDDLNPTGSDKRLALWWDQDAGRYLVVLLPAFVREYADFDKQGSQAIELTKTMVCLTACFSAYGNPGALVQAFLDKGADVVWGYDWEVQQRWAYSRDSAFFGDMADTCFPFEAWRKQQNVCPREYRGHGATLRVYGDSTVRLQNVMRLRKEGNLYRAATAYGERVADLSAVVSAVRLQPDEEHSEQEITDGVEVIFPGSAPGTFRTATDDKAMVTWIDILAGRTYIAAKGYVGVGCQINVTKSNSDVIQGNFSGAVGYWAVTQNPESVPPMQTFHLNGGCFKVTMLDTARTPEGRKAAFSLPGR